MALQHNYNFSEEEQESRKESESSPERQVKVCSEAQFWTNWRERTLHNKDMCPGKLKH